MQCNRPYCLTFCPFPPVSRAYPLCKPGVETDASYPTDKRTKDRHTAGYKGMGIIILIIQVWKLQHPKTDKEMNIVKITAGP
jgi:hypothetical protein